MKNNKTNKTLIVAALCLLGFCAIAVIFNVYSLGELPASFIGAALGAVITGVVTVVLLEGQSRAEEIKERNVKVFEQKSIIFQNYINQVWEVWEDQIITADEFQKLTADYYSKLMIYLKPESVGKISDFLSKIGDCIDKDLFEDYIKLRDNIIEIINILSDEINLGGRIDKKKVDELDEKMFPSLFKKELVEAFKRKLLSTDLFFDPVLEKKYRLQNEYLIFRFKEFPKCQISIGPFDNPEMQIKIGLDISPQLHQFDKYRQTPKKYSYWIKTVRNDTGNDLLLNEKLPQDGDAADEIENNNLGKIAAFGFNDARSLEPFRGNFRKVAVLLALRAEYYLNAFTIDKKHSMAELPEVILGKS
jgi:hypothetical protein